MTALDIEPEMIDSVQKNAEDNGVLNMQVELRDFIANGTGVASGTQDHVMVYNLLHVDQPIPLLNEAHRILRPDGMISVIHWRSDISTPRGPSLDIRPTASQCAQWMRAAGFQSMHEVDLTTAAPYHYALIASVQHNFYFQ